MSEDNNYAVVRTINGEQIRIYTQREHGEDFLGLAKQFARKNGYVIEGLKDDEIETVAHNKNRDKVLGEAKKAADEAGDKLKVKPSKKQIDKAKEDFDKAVEDEAKK